MHANLSLSLSTLLAFALVLSRISSAFVFVPLPTQEAGPSVARIAIALASTFALFPRWPTLNADHIGLATMALWMFSELALGTCIGLLVSFISESLTFGAQVLSLQAGYGYASVVDPTTQADSNVLPVLAQLTAGLLFFTTGLHRYVITAFADSLDSFPPGTFTVSRELAKVVINVGASIFSVGIRLSLPIVGLLLMTDTTLAVLGRISSQLQMGHNSYPVKMMVTLAMLATVLAVAPSLYGAFASDVFATIRRTILR